MTRLLTCALGLAAFTACAYPTASDTGSPDDVVLEWPDIGNQPEFPDGAWVYGQVVSPSTAIGVAGAIVAVDVDGEMVWTVSLDGGRFRLQLPRGEWTLGVEKGRYVGGGVVDLGGGDVEDYHLVLQAGDVEIGVVIGEYDEIGHLITDLGIPSSAYPTVSSILDDPVTLAATDVLFLTCGTDRGTGSGYTAAEGAQLRAWVEAGGTLYTSDWEWEAFAQTAPGGLRWDADPRVGSPGYVQAQVMDRGLQTLLGSAEATLAFDLGQWAVPAGPGTAEMLVQGVPPGGGVARPLAAIDRIGDGRLIYTSFHNEAQATDDMELILYEMILSL
ncbi:MAG: hypothetical protein EP330_23200 [Deltaproteobacteria bacterium]|nr:MAG: hypothetical protein EP330_23200 [Deltaproteobacteria bacterium]